MPETKFKPRVITRVVDEREFTFDIPQCQSVGNGDNDGDIIGCPCNHTTFCNGSNAPHKFDMEDVYDMKTTGFPSWCPLQEKDLSDE